MLQGYDMEDAMIINKQSQERGLACGFIYKMRAIDLRDHNQSNHVSTASVTIAH